jgi:hypothetical protein
VRNAYESRTIITEPRPLSDLQSTQVEQSSEGQDGVMAGKVSKKDMTTVKASLSRSPYISDRQTNKLAGAVQKIAKDARTPSVTAKPKTPKVPVKGKK